MKRISDQLTNCKPHKVNYNKFFELKMNAFSPSNKCKYQTDN